MVPPALDWFIKLGARYTNFSNPPTEALDLCNALAIAIQSKNEKLQVNRVFKKFNLKLPTILNWLNSQYLYDAISDTKDQQNIEIYSEVIVAFDAIKAGYVPSTKWGMEAQRGVNTGFSTTLEAAALFGYLTKIKADDWVPENVYPVDEDLQGEYLLLAYVCEKRKYQGGPLFTQAKSLEIASSLFKVNKDNLRKYATLKPINDQSEVAVGLFGLTRINKLAEADKFFDVEAMVEAAKFKVVTI